MIRKARWFELVLLASAIIAAESVSSEKFVAAAEISSPKEFEAKSAKIGTPKELVEFKAAQAMLPPGVLFNVRESHLRDHHRPVPIGRLPIGMKALVAPLTETATSVSTVISPAAQAAIEFVGTARVVEVPPETLSTVAEPTVAIRGNEILVTGNWFAAFSRNAGATFQYRNPAAMFPGSPQGEFCCDQIAVYDKPNDVMFWALQYINNEQGNTLRLAVAKGNDISTEKWRYYDLTPKGIGNWEKEWFDFPDLVLGKRYLYITSNVYGTTTNQPFTRSVLIRVPLLELAGYEALNVDYFSSESQGSLRATQGAGDTIYWGAHVNEAVIVVFAWPEGTRRITQREVHVEPWSDESRVAPGPDGLDWLGRADSRITAAWVSGDYIGFVWTASQDRNFPFPHVRAVIIDKSDYSVVAQPHLWNKDLAFAYPAAAPNERGEVGVSVHFGGKLLNPSHAVGMLWRPENGSRWQWDLVSSASGTHGPARNVWGDFLAVRLRGEESPSWVTIGFTLQGGRDRTNIEIRYAEFRRRGP